MVVYIFFLDEQNLKLIIVVWKVYRNSAHENL